MVRQHGSLEKDEETNQAAWEAARGALIGSTKVCIIDFYFFHCDADGHFVSWKYENALKNVRSQREREGGRVRRTTMYTRISIRQMAFPDMRKSHAICELDRIEGYPKCCCVFAGIVANFEETVGRFLRRSRRCRICLLTSIQGSYRSVQNVCGLP